MADIERVARRFPYLHPALAEAQRVIPTIISDRGVVNDASPSAAPLASTSASSAGRTADQHTQCSNGDGNGFAPSAEEVVKHNPLMYTAYTPSYRSALERYYASTSDGKKSMYCSGQRVASSSLPMYERDLSISSSDPISTDQAQSNASSSLHNATPAPFGFPEALSIMSSDNRVRMLLDNTDPSIFRAALRNISLPMLWHVRDEVRHTPHLKSALLAETTEVIISACRELFRKSGWS